MTYDPHNPPGGFDILGLPAEIGNCGSTPAGGFQDGSAHIRSCIRKGDRGECPGHIPNVLLPSVCIYCDREIDKDGNLLPSPERVAA